MLTLDIYSHVRKYWETIDRASLHNFITITSKQIKEDKEFLELIKGYPDEDWFDLIREAESRIDLVNKVKERLEAG